MSLLHVAVEEKKLDTRMVERNLTRGIVQQDDVKKAVSALPDDSANAEWVSIESLAADESGDASSSH